MTDSIPVGFSPILSSEQQAIRDASIVPPLHSVLKRKDKQQNKEEAYLEWIREALNVCRMINEPIAETQLSNLLLFQGIQTHLGRFTTGESSYQIGDETEPFIDPHGERELTINNLYDTVMQLSNKLSQFNITTLAVPHSSEQTDREAARVTKEVLQTIKYINNMTATYRDMIKESMIMGESYIFPLWDSDKDDICYRRRLPWEKGLEPRQCPEDVRWLLLWDYMHIDDLQLEYPDKEERIIPTKDASSFDVTTLYTQKLENHVLVIELYGRSTKYMKDGLYIKCAPEVILEGPMENPIPRIDSSIWGNLPIERLTDIDIPGSITPISTFQILAPLQHKINQFYTQIAKNLLLGAHFKMLRPRQGKISSVSLANTSTYIDYVYPYEPKMLSMATVPVELFQTVQLMQQEITKLQGLQPITKGETGSEVRSAKQVEALRGIESVRGSDRIQKKNDLVVAVDRKTLAIIGKYYKQDSKRLINIVGKDKRALIRSFDVSVLNKPYDVRLQPIDGLPEDPAEKIRAVAQLMQIPAFADLYSKEQWADILDLGTPEKFFDDTKTALQKAEWENQEFIEGRNPPDVLPGDDHILHWRIHMSWIRSQDFLELSKEQQDLFVNHVTQHEEVMVDRLDPQNSIGNPLEAQRYSTLSGFPAFFKPLPPPPAPQGMGLPPNGPQMPQQGPIPPQPGA